MQSLTFITLSRNTESSDELREAIAATAAEHICSLSCESYDQMLADVNRLKPSAAIIEVGVDAERAFTLIKQLITLPAPALPSSQRPEMPRRL